MKYIVYLTVNTKNNKIYVGVHNTEDPDVFDGYIGNGVNRFIMKSLNNPKTPFEFAVKKYGFDAFKRTTISVFDTLIEALDLEAEIVNEEFIKRSDTYNVTIGGGMPPKLNKMVYQYTLEGDFIKEWESITEAAKYYNINSAAIGHAALYKRTCLKYLWSDIKVDKLNLDEYNVYDPKIRVYTYNESGEFVQSYDSMNQCAQSLQDSLVHIQRAIKMGVRVKGYFISDKFTPFFEKPKFVRLSGMVHQYNLDGTYIKSYNSIKEIEKEFGESMKGINESIKLGRMYKNYLWLRGEKQDFVKPYISTKPKARKIGQYTMEGELVKVFNTVREARKEFPNVGKVLNGTATHCHNFKFKYLEEVNDIV